MKSNEFVCPNCGANLVVNENKVNMKAKERIEALKAAGLDVSNLFAIVGSNGEEKVAKDEGGKLTILLDNDPIFEMIIKNGAVPNRNLFRRWVMAQMFHHLYDAEKHCSGNFTKTINKLGYEYTWKMVVNEFYAQMKMAENDKENFYNRHRWFNKGVVIAMAGDYMNKLVEFINDMPRKRCKGVPYVKFKGVKNVFVEDIDKKILFPLRRALTKMMYAKDIHSFYYALEDFNRKRIALNYNSPQCSEWVNAYKGSGAYFTMQNLIRFHGCTFYGESKQESLKTLDDYANKYKEEGWKMVGVMKNLISQNNINVEEKIRSWRKQ